MRGDIVREITLALRQRPQTVASLAMDIGRSPVMILEGLHCLQEVGHAEDWCGQWCWHR
jgi:hypothetical protein